MAKQIVKKGDTSRIEYVWIQDSSSTVGAGRTGLVFNTASLVASSVRMQGARTAITLATQTVTGAFSSGGFVEIDATEMPGLYRLDVPDAVFATGADKAVVMLKGATNMAPVVLEYQLVDVDLEDTVRMGLTALPTGTPAALNGLPTVNASNEVKADVVKWLGVAPNVLATGRVDASVGDIATTPVQTIWDKATTGLTVVGSIGKRLVDNVDAAVTTRATPAQVNTEVLDVMNVDTFAEPTAVFAATTTLVNKIGWLFTLARNKITQSTTTQSLRNDADAANISTATVSDDGTTFIRGEWA